MLEYGTVNCALSINWFRTRIFLKII